jgi:hypothetical protein
MWKKQGPTKWKHCEGASGPSPNWRNPVTGKQQLVAINGSHGDALFEATDETLTSWAKVTSAFTPMRGGGGQLWHPLPMNVDGSVTTSQAQKYTHIIQIDPRGSGQPNFVLLKFDYATSVASVSDCACDPPDPPSCFTKHSHRCHRASRHRLRSTAAPWRSAS